MKNNKGYTLVELVLTMAIFGVIMLGVIAIMRSTAVTFNDGADEIAVQTEAQIVASQIEDLMAGTDTLVSFGAGVCTIKKASKDYYIALNTSENQLKYAIMDTGVTPGTSDWSLMAEYVTAFSVSGLDFGNPGAGDNCAQVSISLDKNGYKATAIKDVYFRNTVENKSNQDDWVSVAGNNNNQNQSQPNTHYVELPRYGVLAIGDYGIVSGVTMLADTSSYYEFVDSEGEPTNTEQKFIGCNDTLLTDFDAETPSVGTYGIKGNKSDGAEVTVIISTPKVSLDVENGVCTLMYDQPGVATVDNPRTCFIKTKGINLFNFFYSDDFDAANSSYDLVLYNDDGDMRFQNSEVLSIGSYKIQGSSALSVYTGKAGGNYFYSQNPHIYLKSTIAQDFDGIVIEQDLNNLSTLDKFNNAGVSTKASEGKLRLSVTLNLDGDGTTFTGTGDLAVVTAGMKLDSGKHVGNVY